jgi:hypothetical protein
MSAEQAAETLSAFRSLTAISFVPKREEILREAYKDN